jgi:hypothetical protein
VLLVVPDDLLARLALELVVRVLQEVQVDCDVDVRWA